MNKKKWWKIQIALIKLESEREDNEGQTVKEYERELSIRYRTLGGFRGLGGNNQIGYSQVDRPEII